MIAAFESPRMRVFVDPGTYGMSNLGDIAMLQIAIRRLRSLWPNAVFSVMTENPAVLDKYCPGVLPVPVSGLREWLVDHPLLGSAGKLLPEPVGRFLRDGERIARNRFPKVTRTYLQARTASHGCATSNLTAFLDSLEDSDLLVISGQGSINDAHRKHALQVMNLLECAIFMGIPTVMVGQGIGPIHDDELFRRAECVLPRVDIIGVRDRRYSIPLLLELGTEVDRVAFTGDAAVEFAYLRRSPTIGHAMGVSLRQGKSSQFDETTIETIRPVILDFAARVNAPLLPVPIKIGTEKDDRSALSLLLREPLKHDRSGGPVTPEESIQAISNARVVVSGTYHAAVFALAQGIPTVCVSNSAYYDSKFGGLVDLFPNGSTLIRLHAGDDVRTIAHTLQRLWACADELRPALLHDAETQIPLAHAAYSSIGMLIRERRSLPRVLGSRAAYIGALQNALL